MHKLKVTSISFALAAATASQSGFCAAESAVKVAGFVDSQVQVISDSSRNLGVFINDGAIYFTKELDSVDFMLDLPFRLIRAGSPDFSFATLKGQAYVGQRMSSGFRWKLGQFDTTYGFEANDTVNIPFTRQGNLYNFTDPFVHLGLQVGYDFSKELALNLLVSSPNDTGSLTGGKNPQFGAQVTYSSDFRFAIGGIVNKSSVNDKVGYYADMTAGYTAGALAIDTEVNLQKREGEVDPTGAELKSGLGTLLQLLYSVNDSMSFGARGEYITNISKTDPRGSGGVYLEKQLLAFVGPQFNLTKDLKLKIDYAYQADTQYGITDKNVIHSFQAAGVLRF